MINCKKGFTLFELMIAIVIGALTLTALVEGFVGIMVLNEMSREKTIAINHAQYVMEQFQDTNFSNLTTTDWTTWATNNGYNTLDNEQINVSFNALATDLFEITTTVTWQTRNRPMAVSFLTLRSVY